MDISEETHHYISLKMESREPQTGLQGDIDYILEEALPQNRVGKEFERLIKQCLFADPLQNKRFSDV